MINILFHLFRIYKPFDLQVNKNIKMRVLKILISYSVVYIYVHVESTYIYNKCY